MTSLLACDFKVNYFNEKSIAESIGKSMAYFGVHLFLLVLSILFHEVLCIGIDYTI